MGMGDLKYWSFLYKIMNILITIAKKIIKGGWRSDLGCKSYCDWNNFLAFLCVFYKWFLVIRMFSTVIYSPINSWLGLPFSPYTSKDNHSKSLHETQFVKSLSTVPTKEPAEEQEAAKEPFKLVECLFLSTYRN